VSDRVLLSAGVKNAPDVIETARRHGIGAELMAFAMPDVLDNDWQHTVETYRTMTEGLPLLTLHGPFFDMAPGSIDRRINDMTMERYRHALDIARMLGARVVVFHANFIASLKNEDYRIGWQSRNVEFFARVADYAGEQGVTAAVENMWEFDPDIITDVLARVNHPHLRACLDVGHAHLFSQVPLEAWLATVSPFLVHAHLNNNDGILDIHRAFPNGVLNYHDVIARLRALPQPPSMTLEMDTVADMEASLPYFDSLSV
jgi:sugar phosphate isomerase/epimerase